MKDISQIRINQMYKFRSHSTFHCFGIALKDANILTKYRHYYHDRWVKNDKIRDRLRLAGELGRNVKLASRSSQLLGGYREPCGRNNFNLLDTVCLTTILPPYLASGRSTAHRWTSTIYYPVLVNPVIVTSTIKACFGFPAFSQLLSPLSHCDSGTSRL